MFDIVLQDIDISSCSTKDLEFTVPFQLMIIRDGHLTAVIGYFGVEFTKGDKKVCNGLYFIYRRKFLILDCISRFLLLVFLI